MITSGNRIQDASYKLSKMALKNTPSRDPSEIKTISEKEMEINEERVPQIINTLDEIDTFFYEYIEGEESRRYFQGGMIADEDDEIEFVEGAEPIRLRRDRQIPRPIEDQYGDFFTDESSVEDDEDFDDSDYEPSASSEDLSVSETNVSASEFPFDEDGYVGEATIPQVVALKPPLLKLQEKVSKLSMLTRGLNKIINFSSPVVVEELRKSNNILKTKIKKLTPPYTYQSFGDGFLGVIRKLENILEKITSAVNSFSGNFVGIPQIGGNLDNSSDGNTMFEIYKASPRKRFF